MKTMALYLLATVAISGIFYSGYLMLLRREALFGFNRLYLLISLVLPMMLPLVLFVPSLSWPAAAEIGVTALFRSVLLDPVVVTASRGNSASVWLVAAGIYVAVFILLFMRLLLRLLRFRAIAQNSVADSLSGISLRWTTEEIIPFSFWRTVYLPAALRTAAHSHEIIRHELAHVRSLHSFDIMLAQLLQIVCWFNPFLVLTERALRENHEFEADRAVLGAGADPQTYTSLLLGYGTTSLAVVLGNNLNYSLIKRRFTMFYKHATPNARLKAAVAVPLAVSLALMFVMGCKQPAEKNTAPAAPQATETPAPAAGPNEPAPPPPPPPPPAGEVFTVVDQMPEFPGGTDGMMQYMFKSVKYPEDAKSKGMQGTVYVSFVVETDGRVNQAKVIRGIGKSCDEEALRVVRSMPAWKPGMQKGTPVRVQFNLPVSFRLN